MTLASLHRYRATLSYYENSSLYIHLFYRVELVAEHHIQATSFHIRNPNLILVHETRAAL